MSNMMVNNMNTYWGIIEAFMLQYTIMHNIPWYNTEYITKNKIINPNLSTLQIQWYCSEPLLAYVVRRSRSKEDVVWLFETNKKHNNSTYPGPRLGADSTVMVIPGSAS